MTSIGIRRLLPCDSLEELTALLHRAFAPMGEQGVNCTCVDQTVDMTRQRIRRGDCFVAVVDDKAVGTMTLETPDGASPVRRYRESKVASLHQFAVDPSHQRMGIGRALLRTAESWARRRQYLELALDTPAPAERLRAFYGRWGFRLADVMRLEGKAYLSVVLSKPVALATTRSLPIDWPVRRPAEIAAMAHEARALRQRGRKSATCDRRVQGRAAVRDALELKPHT